MADGLVIHSLAKQIAQPVNKIEPSVIHHFKLEFEMFNFERQSISTEWHNKKTSKFSSTFYPFYTQ